MRITGYTFPEEEGAVQEKLLIVDDEKGVTDMLKSYFEMRSFQVYTAYGGEEALNGSD